MVWLFFQIIDWYVERVFEFFVHDWYFSSTPILILLFTPYLSLTHFHHLFKPTHQLTHPITFHFCLKFKSFWHSLTHQPATLLKYGTFGAFIQLHKVLILLCICTLTRKFTFLRKGPKSLKDKMFCSFNEDFEFVEIFGF